MATKTLPAGDVSLLLAVYKAVGPGFFRRLLRPLLSRQVELETKKRLLVLQSYEARFPPRHRKTVALQVSPLESQRLQKIAATCAVGLAVLSSLCQAKQIAQTRDVIDMIPVFSKVSMVVSCWAKCYLQGYKSCCVATMKSMWHIIPGQTLELYLPRRSFSLVVSSLYWHQNLHHRYTSFLFMKGFE